MNIDKRYIVLLADHTPHKINKWYKRLAIFSWAIMLIGLFFLSNTLHQPLYSEADDKSAMKIMYTGMGMTTAGTLLFATSVILTNKEKGRRRRQFLKHFEEFGDLPPWPEEIKPSVKGI